MAIDRLRVATAGSVDDGKSTLIGRILVESHALFQDQVSALERTRSDGGAGAVDLASITDGLRAEREQGITIDVAHRFFSTPGRRFVLADTPGHEEFTANMATGVSTADVVVLLCDASRGVTMQSRRHAAIAALFGAPHVIVCVNKMDLVGFDARAFEALRAAFLPAFPAEDRARIPFVPVSARDGDNVATRSARMAWYDGPTLMDLLVGLKPPQAARGPARFLVQQAQGGGHAGLLASGTLAIGDAVLVQPGGEAARIARLSSFDGDAEFARAPRSLTIHLDRAVACGRGDLIAAAAAPASVTRTLRARVVWFAPAPLTVGRPMLLGHATRTTSVRASALDWRIDMENLARVPAAALAANDIGQCRLRVADALAVDPYAHDRATGGAILIDPVGNDTVGAVIVDAAGDAP
jgi:sulfate adenylyltransferase large subunit